MTDPRADLEHMIGAYQMHNHVEPTAVYTRNPELAALAAEYGLKVIDPSSPEMTREITSGRASWLLMLPHLALAVPLRLGRWWDRALSRALSRALGTPGRQVEDRTDHGLDR